jgi:hypothetical protein
MMQPSFAFDRLRSIELMDNLLYKHSKERFSSIIAIKSKSQHNPGIGTKHCNQLTWRERSKESSKERKAWELAEIHPHRR